jgi:hypothetical protein
MSNHSRRAVLAGIAAAPALAAPSLAMSAISVDAELIELGRAFDDLWAKYDIASELSEPRYAAEKVMMGELDRRFTVNGVRHHISNEEYKKVWARRDREFPEPSPSVDDITDMMDPFMRKIMALPASTFAGLAVKARVAKWACGSYWNEPDGNCDWDQLMARKLIEAVLSADGFVS